MDQKNSKNTMPGPSSRLGQRKKSNLILGTISNSKHATPLRPDPSTLTKVRRPKKQQPASGHRYFEGGTAVSEIELTAVVKKRAAERNVDNEQGMKGDTAMTAPKKRTDSISALENDIDYEALNRGNSTFIPLKLRFRVTESFVLLTVTVSVFKIERPS